MDVPFDQWLSNPAHDILDGTGTFRSFTTAMQTGKTKTR